MFNFFLLHVHNPLFILRELHYRNQHSLGFVVLLASGFVLHQCYFYIFAIVGLHDTMQFNFLGLKSIAWLFSYNHNIINYCVISMKVTRKSFDLVDALYNHLISQSIPTL